MLKAIKFLTCADIPEMVLIRAHFNGLIKDIYLRDSEIREISKNSKETVYELKVPSVRKRGDHYIKEIWKSKEEIINESFNTILLTLPPEHLGQVVEDLFWLKFSYSFMACNPRVGARYGISNRRSRHNTLR